jgi:hypothetical protein
MAATTLTDTPTPTSLMSPNDPGLLWINAPHFCAGGEVVDGIVRGCVAPIISYMRGWHIDRVRAYCRRKRWDWLTCGVDPEGHH